MANNGRCRILSDTSRRHWGEIAQMIAHSLPVFGKRAIQGNLKLQIAASDPQPSESLQS
jgi:hypothetical protein